MAQAPPPSSYGASSYGASSYGASEIDLAFVKPIDFIAIPAEAAGKLISLPVREGEMVNEGDEVARLSDAEAQLNYKVAHYEHQAALKEAENDVRVKAAEAAEKVRRQEHESALDANLKVPNSVTKMEVKRLELDARHAELQTEMAKFQFDVATITTKVQEGKMEVAIHEVRKRRVSAPFTGMVVRYEKHLGEWVNVGEPIIHFLRIDRLYVTKHISADDIGQSTILGRPVDINIELPDGNTQHFRSEISWFNPEVGTDQRYEVRAEIENPQMGGKWLVYPGSAGRYDHCRLTVETAGRVRSCWFDQPDRLREMPWPHWPTVW